MPKPYPREFREDVIRVAVQDVEADILHFDHSFSAAHDRLCHCPYCIDGFHRFVADEIPGIVHAAGYDRPDQLSPPPAGNAEYLTHVKELHEPGAIAWALFHAAAGTRALAHFADFARALSPRIGINKSRVRAWRGRRSAGPPRRR